MKRRDWLSLALLSSATRLRAARPRYGGTLRVFPTLPPVNLEPFSQLVTATQMDAAKKVCRFTLRSNVVLQGGTAWTAAYAAEKIKAAMPGTGASAAGSIVIVAVDSPQPDLPLQLDQKVLIESGPFEPVLPTGPKPTLRAYDAYWNGRPFLDAIELAPSAQDADLIELNVAGSRRFRLDNHRLWSTAPIELVAIDASNAPPAVRQALSLAIDRVSIVKVLLQGHGEVAGGLAPQWISGYAFAFPTQTDLVKARAALGNRSQALTLSYPAGDTLLRLIAERIAVNARDIGLPIQPKSVAGAELRMLREPVREWPGFDVERAAMEERKLVPVVHVPHLYAVHSRVKGWDDAHDGKSAAIHLEAIWVDA
jgi:Bacterial extracellular solute-binding proteins, family 5 Middle